MEEIVVNSWEEIFEKLYDGMYNQNINRFRSEYCYRGLSDKNYTLTTTLSRGEYQYPAAEKGLIRNFKKYSRMENYDSFSMWEWLTLAQHYGLPTRLMDWTFSPLVALHFATNSVDKYETDGVIWSVNYNEVHRKLPRRLQEILANESSTVFTSEMLENEFANLDVFDGSSDQPYMLFFEPISINPRVVNQYSLHSIISNNYTSVNDVLNQSYISNIKKIIIPGDLKWEIRDKLDTSNITERVLFPGLDGLSKWLTRHYHLKSTQIQKDDNPQNDTQYNYYTQE